MSESPQQNPQGQTKTYKLKKRLNESVNAARNHAEAERKIQMPSLQTKMSINVKKPERQETLRKMITSAQSNHSSKADDKEDIESEGQAFYEVNGTQVRLDKSYLSFVEKTGRISNDVVLMTNNGSTVIYYEWKRLGYTYSFKDSCSDKEERFYCHYVLFSPSS